MGILTPPRVEQPEHLEEGQAQREDVAENLADMQRLNCWLGGVSALTRHLYPRLLRLPDPVSILDVGTGLGGILTGIRRWAFAHRRQVQLYALDISLLHLELASATGQADHVGLLCASAPELPFEEGAVDYVISTLLLHHFTPHELPEFLRRSAAVARRGMVMSDLVRGWVPYFGFKLLQPLFSRNHLTQHDGAASIRRAYTPTELQAAAVQAGMPQSEVHPHFPWRQTLVMDHKQ